MSLNRRNCRAHSRAPVSVGSGTGARIALPTWHGLRHPKSKTVELQTAQPATRRDDPKARALFDEVSKAYKALVVVLRPGPVRRGHDRGGKSEKQVGASQGDACSAQQV